MPNNTIESCSQLYAKSGDMFLKGIEFHLNRSMQGDAHEAIAIVKHIADADQNMLAKLESEWNVGRFPDSRGRSEKLTGTTPYDRLVFQVRSAARYAAELARDPAEIQRLLHASSGVPTMPHVESAQGHSHASA